MHVNVLLVDCYRWEKKTLWKTIIIIDHIVILGSAGAVAIKTLNVSEPSPQQLQGFKNEVAVLR